MKTTVANLLGLLALITLPLVVAKDANANSPPPWYACEGLVQGDSCDPYGGDHGVCTMSPECTDQPDTTVNECLVCDADDDEEGGCHAVGGKALLAGLLGAMSLLALRKRQG